MPTSTNGTSMAARLARGIAACVLAAAFARGQLMRDLSPTAYFATSGMPVYSGIPYSQFSRPRVADLNGNGRPDLVMYDGTAVSVMLDPTLGVSTAATGYETAGALASGGSNDRVAPPRGMRLQWRRLSRYRRRPVSDEWSHRDTSRCQLPPDAIRYLPQPRGWDVSVVPDHCGIEHTSLSP